VLPRPSVRSPAPGGTPQPPGAHYLVGGVAGSAACIRGRGGQARTPLTPLAANREPAIDASPIDPRAIRKIQTSYCLRNDAASMPTWLSKRRLTAIWIS
jgi:hypothetical protein